MAQEVVRKFTCDRCKKPYNETPERELTKVEAEKKNAKPPPLLHAEGRLRSAPEEGIKDFAIHFEDLCPKCEGRVFDLLVQMRLDNAVDPDKNAGEQKEPVGAPPKDPVPEQKPKTTTH